MLFFFPRETNPTGQRESRTPLPDLSGTFCLLGVFSIAQETAVVNPSKV